MRQVRLAAIWTLLLVSLIFVLSNWDTVRVGILNLADETSPRFTRRLAE